MSDPVTPEGLVPFPDGFIPAAFVPEGFIWAFRRTLPPCDGPISTTQLALSLRQGSAARKRAGFR